jgi:serine/threonine-protein kinase
MGTVYLAERADEQYLQKVALKIVTRGLLHGELPLRFRAERQILARLNHPHIARLIDGGQMLDGTPFIVMEYVEGLRIDHYCEQHQLSTYARLGLIQQVCGAIHYAHQHLIIHRDLKPANILVTSDGVPKLLDFGIAKLLDATESAAAQSPITHVLDRVLTPEHASPEQLRGEPVGTASDVYGLGVLLYELLAGRPPYRLESRSLYEIERAIHEQSPLAPSASVAADARATGTARLRALARELAGDLDNIVLKAINPQPERRYASAAALAQDIQNYIDGRPVLARPDTWTYRTRKFIRRNAFAVASVASATILIATLVAFSTIRIAAERDNAERERQTATRVSQFMIGAFRLANPNELPGRKVTAQEVLDAAAKHVDEELADEPQVRIASMRTIAETYWGMGLLDEAHALLLRAVADSRADPRASRLDLVRALESLGGTELSMFLYDDANRAFDEALSIRIALNQEGTDEGIRLLCTIAGVRRRTQQFAEAFRIIRRAEAFAEALSPPDPTVLGQVYMSYGMAHLAAGDARQAESYARRSLPLVKGVVETGLDLYQNSLNTLATALRKQFRTQEAEVVYRQFLDRLLQRYGPDHYMVGTALNNYSFVLVAQGKYQAAAASLLESLRIGELNSDSRPIASGVHRFNLGSLHHLAGELHEAIRQLDMSLEIWRSLHEKYPTRLVKALLEKSATLRDLGQLQDAQATFDEAERITSEKLKPDDPIHGSVLQVRGALRLARGDLEPARRDLRQARDLLQEQNELERVADASVALGEAAAQSSRLDEARIERERVKVLPLRSIRIHSGAP